MREFAKTFYRSKAWEDCRKAYAKSKGGLCEMCLANGIYKPGKVVHHIVHLNPDNISDPNIALGWHNLMLLCQDHHAQVHKHSERRYYVRADGGIVAR